MPMIRFGHSPDPDDAFMFYAIARNKIDTRGLRIVHVVEDIESLNQRALRGELEATAVSVHAYAFLADHYAIMRSGASIGEKYGPIVVSREPLDTSRYQVRYGTGSQNLSRPYLVPLTTRSSLRGKRVAIPGTLTTANLVLKLFEKEFSYVLVPFDKILDYVKTGRADAGLVIHEGQITYQDKGLHKVIDLGEWWWEKTKLPLPLGVDVVRKNLGLETMKVIARIFKESILYSLEHREEALDYALPFGRGISRELGDQFVSMYVNHYTRELGQKGEEGIRALLIRGFVQGLLPKKVVPEFI
ncbi:MAG: ABC transporter substrate-binding protein [Candidatus Omnitrophica bacterium]|nr:ABC transporter substrate-binding protein [Candidatus Omnitrophota bacterium]